MIFSATGLVFDAGKLFLEFAHVRLHTESAFQEVCEEVT